MLHLYFFCLIEEKINWKTYLSGTQWKGEGVIIGLRYRVDGGVKNDQNSVYVIYERPVSIKKEIWQTSNKDTTSQSPK